MPKIASRPKFIPPQPAAAQLVEVLARELPRDQSNAVQLPSRREVAERFGVSLPTVTVALRELQRRRLVYWVPGKGMFCGGPAAMRARVLTIGLLGWFSHVAPSVGGAADTYRMYLLHDLMAHAAAMGCQIMVIPNESNAPIDIESLQRTPLDALLLKDLGDPANEIRALRKLGLPLLSDSLKFAEFGVGYVGHDVLALVSGIVRQFTSFGHQRIGYIANETSSPSQNQMMRQTFFTALVDAGLIYDFNEFWRVCSWDEWKAAHSNEFLYAYGARSARELLSRPDRPTAIFAWQPQMAQAIRDVAREMGLSVPRDVSILTDVPEESMTPFSTFVHPHAELARRLLERLMQVIDEPDMQVRDLIPRQFVDKGSIFKIT